MHVASTLERYLAQLRADGRSSHTVAQCARHGRLLVSWLARRRITDVRRVGHAHVAQFLASPEANTTPNGETKKATSTNALRSSIRTFASYCHASGLARENFARLVRRARCGQPPPRALSPDEQRRLLRTLSKARDFEGKRDHALFALLLGSGLRIGSALALDIEDVDLAAGELRIRRAKGDRPAIAFMPRALAKHLRTFIGKRPSGPLFTDRNGRRITSRHVGRRLKMWLREAGITRSASPHSLRHSFAVTILQRTGDVLLTKAALGHASISSTLSYLTAVKPDVKRALG